MLIAAASGPAANHWDSASTDSEGCDSWDKEEWVTQLTRVQHAGEDGGHGVLRFDSADSVDTMTYITSVGGVDGSGQVGWSRSVVMSVSLSVAGGPGLSVVPQASLSRGLAFLGAKRGAVPHREASSSSRGLEISRGLRARGRNLRWPGVWRRAGEAVEQISGAMRRVARSRMCSEHTPACPVSVLSLELALRTLFV